MTEYCEPEDELLQASDEQGLPIRAISRMEAHSGSKIRHWAVHVVVERPDGRIILQKRSRRKRIKPGLWDTSVGGHAHAGESLETAALRELEEELGVRGVRPVLAYQYPWESEIEREFVTTYHLVWPGPVHFPVDEIQELHEWRVEEIQASPVRLFTPNFLHELGRFLAWRNP